MKTRRSLCGLLILTLAAFACGGGGSSPTAPGGAGVGQVEAASFKLVNAERAQRGVGPTLASDTELSKIARDFSEQMRDEGFFGHTTPKGMNLPNRLKAAGYTFTFAGENLAMVTNSGDPAGFAHGLLMENSTHRDNILSTRFARLGVGVASQGNTIWITQIFIKQ